MSELQHGSAGQEVGRWQSFLRDRGWLSGAVDGVFGAETSRATARFQASRRLGPDGIVGPATRRAAAALGFEDAARAAPPQPPPAPQPAPAAPANDFFPPKPSFPPLANNAARQRVFGAFEFRAAPTASNPEAVVITDGWDHENLISVTVPGLAGVSVGSSSAVSRGRMVFHRKGTAQLVALWRAWGEARLLDQIRTFDGAYVARFQRGSNVALSNHAFGSAFDINARWNAIGHAPARRGAPGCLLDLVSIANEHGFYWGGHFASRADGMHFEIAQLG